MDDTATVNLPSPDGVDPDRDIYYLLKADGTCVFATNHRSQLSQFYYTYKIWFPDVALSATHIPSLHKSKQSLKKENLENRKILREFPNGVKVGLYEGKRPYVDFKFIPHPEARKAMKRIGLRYVSWWKLWVFPKGKEEAAEAALDNIEVIYKIIERYPEPGEE